MRSVITRAVDEVWSPVRLAREREEVAARLPNLDKHRRRVAIRRVRRHGEVDLVQTEKSWRQPGELRVGALRERVDRCYAAEADLNSPHASQRARRRRRPGRHRGRSRTASDAIKNDNIAYLRRL